MNARSIKIRDKFGAGIAPLELPIGSELQFRGVADLLTDQALIYEGSQATTKEIPEDLADLEHQVHDNLVEGIVVADDVMLERFLDGDVPSPEELEHTLARGVAAATVFPVVCGSALTAVAIDRLADFICEIGPAPSERPGVIVQAGGGETEVLPDPSGQPLAFVFKTIADPYVGQLSLFKVLSGTVRPDDHLVTHARRPRAPLNGTSTLAARSRAGVVVPAGDMRRSRNCPTRAPEDTLARKGTRCGFRRSISARGCSRGHKARTQDDDDKLGKMWPRVTRTSGETAADRRPQRGGVTTRTLLADVGENLAVTLIAEP